MRFFIAINHELTITSMQLIAIKYFYRLIAPQNMYEEECVKRVNIF